MGSLAGKRQTRAFAIEFRTPSDQFLYALRAFLHQHARRRFIHQAVAGGDRVLQMQSNLIFVAECHRDAALGILGSAFGEFVFGEHQHRAGSGQFYSGTQAGNSGANHQKIEFTAFARAAQSR